MGGQVLTSEGQTRPCRRSFPTIAIQIDFMTSPHGIGGRLSTVHVLQLQQLLEISYCLSHLEILEVFETVPTAFLAHHNVLLLVAAMERPYGSDGWLSTMKPPAI